MTKWRDNRKNANKSTNKVPEHTLALLYEMGIFVKAQYADRQKYVWCNQGYDMLENLFIVRQYTCGTHNISLRTLEIMLKLYPMNYFTYHDYYSLPKHFQLVRADFLIKNGLMIEIKEKHKNRTESIFKLSPKACKIVREFYQLLSGEKRIPEIAPLNYMAKKGATTIDKLRLEFIKKMNQIEPSETKKELFKPR